MQFFNFMIRWCKPSNYQLVFQLVRQDLMARIPCIQSRHDNKNSRRTSLQRSVLLCCFFHVQGRSRTTKFHRKQPERLCTKRSAFIRAATTTSTFSLSVSFPLVGCSLRSSDSWASRDWELARRSENTEIHRRFAAMLRNARSVFYRYHVSRHARVSLLNPLDQTKQKYTRGKSRAIIRERNRCLNFWLREPPPKAPFPKRISTAPLTIILQSHSFCLPNSHPT